MILDRITNKIISPDQLPRNIALGRFLDLDSNEELCSDNIPIDSNSEVSDAILGDTYISTHRILRRLNEEISGTVSVKDTVPSPIIRNVCTEIKVTDFEQHLYDNIRYIKAAFNNPYSKLIRREEKVNVSKAKRITPRSYQYLGAHTEDWLQYSIVTFRPERILTEELSQDYDVYENRLLVAFIQRTLAYLRGRLKAVSDAKDFIKEYKNSLDLYQQGISGSSFWYAKPERNLALYGREYHDQNYVSVDGEDDELQSSQTYQKLHKLLNECVVMLGGNLVQLVNQRSLESITYHDTNVLLSHQNYKHLKSLWGELNSEIQELTLEKMRIEHQEIIRGFSSYMQSVVQYVINKYFSYEIHKQHDSLNWIGTYREGKYKAFPDINAEVENGILTLCVGSEKIRFVCIVDNHIDKDFPDDCCVLKYSLKYTNNITSNIPSLCIDSNLKDVNVIEKVAMLLRSMIIKHHVLSIINKDSYPQALDFYNPNGNARMFDGDKKYIMFDDNFILKTDEVNKICFFYNIDSKYNHLSYNDWGMDNLQIKL